jgi:hypothetical protein
MDCCVSELAIIISTRLVGLIQKNANAAYSHHDKNMQCLIWIKEQSLAHLLIIADKFPLKYDSEPDKLYSYSLINIREWAIQQNWQHKSHTKKNKTNPQHNMCRTPPHTNNTNKIGAH